jgi:hypothetical protein
MTRFLRWEIQRQLRDGEFPSDIRDILTISGGDIHDRVLASGIDLASLDTGRAREIAQSTIQSFRNYFAPILPEVIERLDREARESREPTSGANRPKGQVLGHLCTLVLASGTSWPQGNDITAARRALDICQRSSLYSVFPDPDHRLNLHFNELQADLRNKPQMYRICAFHRFLRASRMAEITRGRTDIQPSQLGILRASPLFF